MSLTDIRSPNLSSTLRVHKAVVESEGGIVVAHNRLAATVGARVLKQGGSAVDAAIATSFAIGVLEPWMSGIGGVGALLVRSPEGEVTAIDAGAHSPAGLDPADFPLVDGSDGDLFGWPNVLEDRNVIGARSVCIPGLVDGLGVAHRQFGRLDWAALVAPAVELARQGPVVDFHTTQWIACEMDRLRRNPACSAYFFPGGKLPLTPSAVSGQVARLPAPALAASLQHIAEAGPRALYEGPLAQALAQDVLEAGGYLQASDLHGFAAAAGPSDSVRYRGREIHLVPELNGGITVAMALQFCERHYRPEGGAPGTATYLAYAQALAQAWAYRLSRLGDAAERTRPSCTSHLSVVDRDGQVVTLTQTLLSSFGSGVMSPRTGILLNNGVNWLDPRPGRVYAIAPGRRALANYAPMLLAGDDDVLGIGGSGGRKIIPAVFHALACAADFGMSLEQCIASPRLDYSAPPTVVADGRLPDDTLAALARHYPTVVADRMESPNHFTILGAVRRQGGRNSGYSEPFHVWTDAVGEDSLPACD